MGRGVRRSPVAAGRVRAWVALVAALGTVLVACSGDGDDGGADRAEEASVSSSTTTAPTTTTTTTVPTWAPLAAGPGTNVYRYTTPADLRADLRAVTPRVYVPNSLSNTVQVIDPATFEIVDEFRVDREPQHVVPSWDMRTLYVNNTQGNTLTPIDPVTGAPGPAFPIEDPYNLYFTPDGRWAMVVAERFQRLDFYDAATWRFDHSIRIRHSGPNHVDFSSDGRYFLISCEFSGWVVKVDLETRSVVGELNVGGQPIDVKLSPDGTVFFVANQSRHGVSVVDPAEMREIQFIPTGRGTHGLYPSRDATKLYASNRLGGSVSVIDFATRSVVATWEVGSSPDMGSVSTDGTQLWLSGRFSSDVVVIDTGSGAVIRRIRVQSGPHGLTLFPQPGRFSMGHTGNYR